MLTTIIAAAALAAAPVSRCERIYLGTQAGGAGQGIVTAVLDPSDGSLSEQSIAAELPRATWLLAEPRRGLLYAVSDPREPGATAAIVSYRIDRASGALTRVGSAAPGGAGPTHLALGSRSNSLFVALYGSGQAAALPTDAHGALGAPASIVQDSGTGPSPRQAAPHAHAVVVAPGGRWLLVPDLGADRVFVYRIDPATPTLTPAPTPFLQLPAGSGPRHLVFAPDGRRAFLVSELAGSVTALDWDARAGRLTVRQTLALDPPDHQGPRSAAEIAITRDGRTLYVSNRTDHSIVRFRIDGGRLTETGRAPSGGRTPWAFALDAGERWMVVANQGSDQVAVLPLGAAIGKPAATLDLAKPVTVAFAGPAQCAAGR